VKFNISQIIEFEKCPVRWYFRYVMRRVPRSTYEAWPLVLGTHTHKFFERFFSNFLPQHHAANLFLDECLNSNDLQPIDKRVKQAAQAEMMATALRRWKSDYEFKTLNTEEVLEAPLGGHTLVGRLDRRVEYMSSMMHYQIKTMGTSTNLDAFITSRRRNSHELGYAYLIQKNFGELPSKMFLNGIRKTTLNVLNSKPETVYVQEFIPLSEDQISGFLADTVRTFESMCGYATISNWKEIPQRREADTNPYNGGKLDPYFWVLMGRDDIHDEELFMDLPTGDYWEERGKDVGE